MSAYTEYLASTASAQAQMDFQERMSNTAHVREVADLKAAGLNPVLSAGGSGASTPSGAEGDYSEVLGILSKSMNNTAKSLNKAIGSLAKALGTTGENQTNRTLDKVESILASNAFQNDLQNNISMATDSTGIDFVNQFLDDMSMLFGKTKIGKKIGTQGIIDYVRKYANAFYENGNSPKIGRAYVKTLTKYGLPLSMQDIAYNKKYGSSPIADKNKPVKYEHKVKTTYKKEKKPSIWSRFKSWWKNTPKTAKSYYNVR